MERTGVSSRRTTGPLIQIQRSRAQERLIPWPKTMPGVNPEGDGQTAERKSRACNHDTESYTELVGEPPVEDVSPGEGEKEPAAENNSEEYTEDCTQICRVSQQPHTAS